MTFPLSGTCRNDRVFVPMELLQCGFDPGTHLFVNHQGLSQVTEVHQGLNGNEKVLRNSISNDCHNMSLYLPVFTPSDLLKRRYSSVEMPKSYKWMKDREAEIKFGSPNSINAPLGIMVPKLFVPMMKWLRC